jgi:acyl-CoA dehydrogenase
MSATLSSLLDDLRAKARAVGSVHGARVDALDETTGAREALSAVARAGLAAWCVPEAWGGARAGGLCAPTSVSVRALCTLRQELAWHSPMLDVMLVMQGLGSHAIALGGPEGLKREILPAVARGELVGAFALTEPDAGSSLAEVALRATRRGDSWVLDGAKTFISNCGIADAICVLARTSGEPGEPGGATMFHVPGSARGLEARRFEVVSPHPIGEYRFHEVVVPDAHRLGEVGAGVDLALAVLARFRASVAAAANGFARRALHESCNRLRARRQFGKPLASFQALRFDVADMDVRLRAAELLVDEAARLVDEGGDAVAAVARAKYFSTESASWICDRAVQHFGGLGVKKGEVVEHLWRDVRALRIYEGTSEVQKLVLAKQILG